jgi:hypothetical protein
MSGDEPQPGGGETKARKSRNRVLALALVAFVLLVFAITIAKLRHGGG